MQELESKLRAVENQLKDSTDSASRLQEAREAEESKQRAETDDLRKAVQKLRSDLEAKTAENNALRTEQDKFVDESKSAQSEIVGLKKQLEEV